MSNSEKISIENINKLIENKSRSRFTGKISVVFDSGVLVSVEKTQNMNNQRVAREVKRDSNAITREEKNEGTKNYYIVGNGDVFVVGSRLRGILRQSR